MVAESSVSRSSPPDNQSPLRFAKGLLIDLVHDAIAFMRLPLVLVVSGENARDGSAAPTPILAPREPYEDGGPACKTQLRRRIVIHPVVGAEKQAPFERTVRSWNVIT